MNQNRFSWEVLDYKTTIVVVKLKQQLKKLVKLNQGHKIPNIHMRFIKPC